MTPPFLLMSTIRYLTMFYLPAILKVETKESEVSNMIEFYIYVCYEIINRCDSDDGSITWMVNGDDMESFTTSEKAVEFCKAHYAKYMIAVEKCDEELYKQLQAEGQ